MQRKHMQSILWSIGTSRVKNRGKSLMTLATAHRITSSPKPHSVEWGAGEVDRAVPPTRWFRTGGWRCDNPVLGLFLSVAQPPAAVFAAAEPRGWSET